MAQSIVGCRFVGVGDLIGGEFVCDVRLPS